MQLHVGFLISFPAKIYHLKFYFVEPSHFFGVVFLDAVNTLALALANLIGGLFVLVHNVNSPHRGPIYWSAFLLISGYLDEQVH